jgi:hypothetical protein
MTTTAVVQSLPVPTSTANRNKSKTYMKGMEGRAGKKTVFGEPVDEDAEGYIADVSMIAAREGVSTPAKPVNVPEKQPKRVASLAKLATTPASSPRPHPSTRPRFTAPSALDSLPSNMFVTSVYFPWPHGKKASKPKDKPSAGEQEYEESYVADESMVEQDTVMTAAVEPDAPLSNVVLPVPIATPAATRGAALQTEREKKRRAFLLGKEYVSPADRQEDEPEHTEEDIVDAQMNGHSLLQAVGQNPNGQSVADHADWERAEGAWESLKVVAAENLEDLIEGTILAWKVSALTFRPFRNLRLTTHDLQALEMDFATFTPEIKVKLGQVTVVKRSISDTPDRLYQVRVLVRPDSEGTEEESEDVENLAVDMQGVTSGEYRILR